MIKDGNTIINDQNTKHKHGKTVIINDIEKNQIRLDGTIVLYSSITTLDIDEDKNTITATFTANNDTEYTKVYDTSKDHFDLFGVNGEYYTDVAIQVIVNDMINAYYNNTKVLPADERISELESTITELTSANETLTGQVGTLTTENETLSGQVQTLTNDNEELENRITSLSSLIDYLESQFTQEELETLITEYEAQQSNNDNESNDNTETQNDNGGG